MDLFKGKKQKHLTAHAVAMVLLRTSLPVGTPRIAVTGVKVYWRKEAAP